MINFDVSNVGAFASAAKMVAIQERLQAMQNAGTGRNLTDLTVSNGMDAPKPGL